MPGPPPVPDKPIEVILVRRLADRLGLPAWIVDTDGRVIYWNAPAAKVLGARREGDEPTLEGVVGYFTCVARDGTVLRVDELPVSVAMRERRPCQVTITVTGKDTTVREFATTAIPLDGQGGVPLGAMAISGRRGRREAHPLGTRGSLPSPRTADGSVIVLDAGTGIHRLADLGPGVGRVDVLLSHLHMGHVLGLGFFGRCSSRGSRCTSGDRPPPPPASTPASPATSPRRCSPYGCGDLPCQLVLHDAPRGSFDLPGATVTADLVCHPGPTLGYRIEADGATLAYLSDHEPALGDADFARHRAWM